MGQHRRRVAYTRLVTADELSRLGTFTGDVPVCNGVIYAGLQCREFTV
jgi:hypothetical protein